MVVDNFKILYYNENINYKKIMLEKYITSDFSSIDNTRLFTVNSTTPYLEGSETWYAKIDAPFAVILSSNMLDREGK